MSTSLSLRRAALACGLLLLSLATAPLAAQSVAPSVDPALFSGMRFRMVGPFRGGRSTAVTGIAEQPFVFYMGTTGGGVWKTDDAGMHWTSVSDGYFDNGNIGAIDVADSDQKTVYVGTGSASIRGNVSVGTGVWKSTDAGATWRHIGLRESGAIGKLVVHPNDPNIVYVAALGHPFGRNPERGIFRTTDGGATWQHVLALNDSTGAVSIVMSPDNPRELWAGMWRAERKPWTIISGGPEGGLYRSRDGGDTWSKVSGGLPEGVVGKVGVTQSPADPNRLWVLIEADPAGGLYRSDDRGETWARVNDESRVRGRGFYYTHVRADPVRRDVVYVMNVPLLRSTDGGATFSVIPVPHGDTHDMWINPTNPDIFALSDDGGTVVTLNGGRTFSTVYNQPTAELYDVQVDNAIPYRIYGSQQDNSAISVLQRRLHNSLRPQQEWGYGAGCETGPVAVHPDHPETIWGGCYGGLINRYHVPGDTRVSVKVTPEANTMAPREMHNRWQWVAPIVVSPLEPRTIYHASQYLYRSRDGGDSWTRISPDLTTNDTTVQGWAGEPISTETSGVETFTTIFAVAPSPHDARTIWVGSDDGRVHITRDDGATWTDITPSDMPLRGTVNRIDVSPHDGARALIAVQRYREDDFAPYIFRTDDHGRTWTRLADGTNGIPADHPVRVVREDDGQRGLLYAGTEFGLFVSFNDGVSWQPLQLNLPATPVTDLKVHRGDLVLSTQGRSFWVLDDLNPLRDLAAEVAADAAGEAASGVGATVAADRASSAPRDRVARLYTPRPAARGVVGAPLREVDLVLPDDLPHGALLHYWTGRDLSSLSIDIMDSVGGIVRGYRSRPDSARRLGTRPLATAQGFYRLVWDLRSSGPRQGRARGSVTEPPPGGQGVKLPPGTYTVRLTADGESHSRELRVTGNPNAPEISQADYEAQYRTASAVRDTIVAINDALASIRALPAAQRASLETVEAALAGFRDANNPLPPSRLLAQYSALYGSLVGDGGYGSGSAEGRPSTGQLARFAELNAEWARLRSQLPW